MPLRRWVKEERFYPFYETTHPQASLEGATQNSWVVWRVETGGGGEFRFFSLGYAINVLNRSFVFEIM
jgi:hypothetical protein